MKLYELKQEQFLEVTIDEAWQYFSNPINLNDITPDNVGFQITSKPEDKMFEGQIIAYKIALFPGIKTNWVTEIKSVEQGKLFIDEQRFGPYKFWYHIHNLCEADGGVIMRDHVYYALPYGFIGAIAHRLFVRRKLHNIFAYRFHRLEERFNKNN